MTRPAKPSMVVLNIGDLNDNGWEWEPFDATEEVDGSGPPGDISLWGHASILLEGNVMMLTSGFHITNLDPSGRQEVNQKTWFLNLTSNEWIQQYRRPIGQVSEPAAGEEGTKNSRRDVAMLAGVFGGVALLVAVLAVLFWYARRQEEYADLPNQGVSNGYDDRGGKFDSLDLEHGRNISITGVESTNPFRRGTRTSEANGLLRENLPRGSPELPPRPPAPLRHHDRPSHGDVETVERVREQQRQREDMFQDSAAQERRRSLRSEMVAWVREWANADAAAQAAEALTRTGREGSGSKREESSTLGGGVKDMPGRAAKGTAVATGAPETVDTGSSTCSDGSVRTLDAYTTPEEAPYSVPPMLPSTRQNHGEQRPRDPTAPLSKKMAEEFPTPTSIPRDSSSPSAYGSGYDRYSHSSTQPLLLQARSSTAGGRDGEGWRDVTPASRFFTNIPLEEEEQTQTHIKRGKPSEDGAVEEMYNPGPARTDDDCRLSSIMDYYAESKPPTPIPELTEGTDDEGEEGYLVPSGGGIRSTAFEEEQAVAKGKGKMVVSTDTAVDEPIVVRSIRMRSKGRHREQRRESIVAPLLSETTAARQNEEAGGKAEKSGIPSLGSSIKRRAAAMAATFNPSSAQPSDRRTSSVGRKSVSNRRPQTSTAGENPTRSTPSRPHRAEIILFTRGFEDEDRDDGSITHMNDKVVQLVYTAPKGKLRVVNPGPRRVSSGGTDGIVLEEG